jgi:aspartyl-tRNA(Asn)/glutamyl-tRNA(Gln) amidotransferase subunit A
VAVAAGLVPVALGSDTGGSVRQPGALCGIAALKPTYGRVSRFGLVAFASSLDQIGPFARSIDEIEALLKVIAGHDPCDSTSSPAAGQWSGPRLHTPPRLGVPFDLLRKGLDADTDEAASAALKRFQSLGCEVVEVSLPKPDHALAAYYIVANAEASANLARYDGVRYGLRLSGEVRGNGGGAGRVKDSGDGGGIRPMYDATRSAGFGPEVKRRIMLGTYALSSGYYDAYYLRAQKARTVIRQGFAACLAEVDAILLPTSPTVAFRLGEKVDDPLAMYLNDVFTIPVNMAGLPGLSFPASLGSRTGLPVGMQLIGRPFDEETLFELVRRYEPEIKLPPLDG